MSDQDLKENSTRKQLSSRRIATFSLSLSLMLAIGVVGYLYYRSIVEEIVRDKLDNLAAATDTKLNQITQWRDERIADASFVASNTSFAHLVRRIVRTPHDAHLRREWSQWLQPMKSNHDYRAISLVNLEGKPLIALGEVCRSAPTFRESIRSVAQSGQLRFTDLFLDSSEKKIALQIFIPVGSEQRRHSSNDAVLVFEIDPKAILFPLIQQWSTPSSTAEILLLKRQGNAFLYLNEIRFLDGRALQFREEFSDELLSSKLFFHNEKGANEGYDYRGKLTHGAIREVPNTPWFLIAKMDSDEILAPAHERGWYVLLFYACLVLTLTLGASLLLRKQKAQHYKQLYEAEYKHRLLTRHYEYLTKFANDIIILFDETGKIIEVNDRAVKCYGYSYEEMIGRNISALRAPEEQGNESFRFSSVQGGEGLLFEALHLRSDTSVFPVEVSLRAITVDDRKMYQSIIRDRTEKKKSEQEILRLAHVTQSIADFVVLTDMNAQISFVNKPMMLRSGYSEEELLGQTPDFLFAKQNPDGLFKEIVRATRAGGWKGDVLVHTKTGEDVWVTLATSQLKEHEKVTGYVIISHDVTQRKKYEEELIQARMRAEQSQKLKEAFIANISHEIRTPLNIIMGYTNLFEAQFAPRVSGSEHEFFVNIERAGERLMRTVDQMITLSTIQTDTYTYRKFSVSANSVIHDLLRQMMPAISAKKLFINFQTSDEDAMLEGDQYAFEEAMRNLIENAIKFTHEGGVSITTATGDSRLTITIADSGIGIAEEYLPRLFDPFSQEIIGYSRPYEGLGLGMALTKKYIEMNRGTISVQSSKGEGTTFTISFPKKISHRKGEMMDIHKPVVPEIPMSRKSNEKKTILLVEDDEPTQKYMRVLLGSKFIMLTASSVDEAWQEIHSNKIDLILMDLSLRGGGDGLELTRRIREIPAFSSVPIIALTAHAFLKDRTQSLAAGCSDFIPKPFRREYLDEVLGKYMM